MINFPQSYKKCVHTEHCCIYNGCKYGDDDCPVWLGLKPQSYPYCDGGYTYPMPIEDAQELVTPEMLAERRKLITPPKSEGSMNQLHRLIFAKFKFTRSAGDELSYRDYTRISQYIQDNTPKQHAFGDDEKDAVEHMRSFVRQDLACFYAHNNLKDHHIAFEAYCSVLSTGHCYPDDGKLNTYAMVDV